MLGSTDFNLKGVPVNRMAFVAEKFRIGVSKKTKL